MDKLRHQPEALNLAVKNHGDFPKPYRGLAKIGPLEDASWAGLGFLQTQQPVTLWQTVCECKPVA